MSGTAKLFRNGRSQAVRLPREFRFSGDRVRVRRLGTGVMLEPLTSDPREWFTALDSFDTEPLRRPRQPKATKRPALR